MTMPATAPRLSDVGSGFRTLIGKIGTLAHVWIAPTITPATQLGPLADDSTYASAHANVQLEPLSRGAEQLPSVPNDGALSNTHELPYSIDTIEYGMD